MSQIVPYVCKHLGGAVTSCIIDNGDPWFKAVDVAKALRHTDTDKATRRHVADDDKRQQGSFNLNPAEVAGLKGNWKTTIYINEFGFFCLIFGSNLAPKQKTPCGR